jgi:DNA-binding GntR family transcriptional regulator
MLSVILPSRSTLLRVALECRAKRDDTSDMTSNGQNDGAMSPLVRDGRTSLAQQLYDSVKREIVEHRLRPETILAEATLAEQYGVSRAPAREALKRLATVGFVRVVPRVGYIVSSVSIRDFDEIFALRLVLEPLAVELAMPRLGDDDAVRLEHLARRVWEIPARPRTERGALLAQVNADFHREISRIAGNSRLEQTIGGLIDELERFMHMLAYSDTVSSLMDEHMVLLETMKSGDAHAAASLMREQLANDHATMRQLILPEVSLVSPEPLRRPA